MSKEPVIRYRILGEEELFVSKPLLDLEVKVIIKPGLVGELIAEIMHAGQCVFGKTANKTVMIESLKDLCNILNPTSTDVDVRELARTARIKCYPYLQPQEPILQQV